MKLVLLVYTTPTIARILLRFIHLVCCCARPRIIPDWLGDPEEVSLFDKTIKVSQLFVENGDMNEHNSLGFSADTPFRSYATTLEIREGLNNSLSVLHRLNPPGSTQPYFQTIWELP